MDNKAIKKIFERSEKPADEIEKLINIVPFILADNDTVSEINERLKEHGYKINPVFTDMEKAFIKEAHPTCWGDGRSNGWGYGHSSCGPSGDFWRTPGHPGCGSSDDSWRHRGHPSCFAGTGKTYKKVLLPLKNKGINNGINY